MDLDLAFDDSDFQRKEELKVGQSTSYNAKMCTELVRNQLSSCLIEIAGSIYIIALYMLH